jgi:hypothetical protein
MSQHFEEDAIRTGMSAKLLAAEDKNLCRHLWACADDFERRGVITPEQARDVRAYISQHVLRAHYLDDPETYERARDSGELDVIFENARSADDPNMSDAANAVRREQNFRRLVADATDVELAIRGQLGEHPGQHAQRYHALMQGLDPAREGKLRAAFNMDQSIDLDDHPRALTEEESNALAGAHFLERNAGQNFDPDPKAERDPFEDSERFMESYIKQRDAEDQARYHPLLNNPPIKSNDERPRDESGKFVSDEQPREI